MRAILAVGFLLLILAYWPFLPLVAIIGGIMLAVVAGGILLGTGGFVLWRKISRPRLVPPGEPS